MNAAARVNAARASAMLLFGMALLPLGSGSAHADGVFTKIPSRTAATAQAASGPRSLRDALPLMLAPTRHAAHPASAVDQEGRNLSVSLPARVVLYGLVKADEIAAHTVLKTASASAAELGLVLDNPIRDPHTAGSYVGVLAMTLNYN